MSSDTSGSSFYFTPTQSPNNSYSEVDSISIQVPNIISNSSVDLGGAFLTSHQPNFSGSNVQVPNIIIPQSSADSLGNGSTKSSPTADGDASSCCSTPSASTLTLRSSSFIHRPSTATEVKTANGDTNVIQICRQKVEVLHDNFQKQIAQLKENVDEQFNEIYSWLSELELNEDTLPIRKHDTSNRSGHISPHVVVTSLVTRRTTFPPLSEELKHKFGRLPALVKGFLTRKLQNTKEALEAKTEILDTAKELLAFDEVNENVSETDIIVHKCIADHLVKAISRYRSIFLQPVSDRIELLQRDRLRREEEMFTPKSNAKRLARPSSATLKRLQRKSVSRPSSVVPPKKVK